MARLKKGGDIIYDHPAFKTTRGNAAELICGAFLSVFGESRSSRKRMSNGDVIDTMLDMMDLLVTTDGQRAKLVRFLDDEESETRG